MCGQIVLHLKGSRAQLAFKRPLSGMDANVVHHAVYMDRGREMRVRVVHSNDDSMHMYTHPLVHGLNGNTVRGALGGGDMVPVLLLESPMAIRANIVANVRMDLEVLLQVRFSIEMLNVGYSHHHRII